MARTLTASDRKALIRLASTLPAGSEARRAILSGLKMAGATPTKQEQRIIDALTIQPPRYLTASLKSDIDTIAGVFGRVHNRSPAINSGWWQVVGESSGNRHKTSRGVYVSKKKPEVEEGSFNDPDLVGGSSHRTFLSAADASKALKGFHTGFRTGYRTFNEMLSLVRAGVITGPKTLKAVKTMAKALEDLPPGERPQGDDANGRGFWNASGRTRTAASCCRPATTTSHPRLRAGGGRSDDRQAGQGQPDSHTPF